MKICEYVDDSDDKFAIAIENIREKILVTAWKSEAVLDILNVFVRGGVKGEPPSPLRA